MRIIPFLLASLLAASAFADDVPNIVITPTRSETPLSQIGSSVTVITADDIQREQKDSVADLLKEVQGVDVVQNGGAGQNATVFMRGAPSEHTLVLIDGVEVNDPTSTSGQYDFSRLSTDNIERIEVLRGNQSTLYGSNAIGGVINIIHKKGEDKPSGWASIEGGSYNTYKADSGISGKVDNVGFNIDVNRFTTSGFPAFDKKLGGMGNDGSDYANFSSKIDAKINDIFSVYNVIHYNNSRAQYDDFGANANNDEHSKELTWRTAADAKLFDGIWDQELGISYYKLNRDSVDDYNGQQSFTGDRTGIDWINHVKANDHNTITFGVDSKYETATTSDFTSSKNQTTNGYLLQDQIGITPQFYTTIGGRVDDNSNFGTATTYRIAPAYTIAETDTLLKASYGTGFKAPSLYQLYSIYGNTGLKPENSIGYDFGFEQPLLHKQLQFGSTFFHTQINNLIDYDFATNKYLNVGAARMNGVENFVKYSPIKPLTLRLQYTYTDAYDEATKANLLNRASNKASFDADYSFLEKGRVGVNVIYTGHRDNYNFSYDPSTDITNMPTNTVVNLTSSWQLTDNVKLFGRIDNLLNKQYENLYGYGTAGFSAYAGVKASY